MNRRWIAALLCTLLLLAPMGGRAEEDISRYARFQIDSLSCALSEAEEDLTDLDLTANIGMGFALDGRLGRLELQANSAGLDVLDFAGEIRDGMATARMTGIEGAYAMNVDSFYRYVIGVPPVKSDEADGEGGLWNRALQTLALSAFKDRTLRYDYTVGVDAYAMDQCGFEMEFVGREPIEMFGRRLSLNHFTRELSVEEHKALEAAYQEYDPDYQKIWELSPASMEDGFPRTPLTVHVWTDARTPFEVNEDAHAYACSMVYHKANGRATGREMTIYHYKDAYTACVRAEYQTPQTEAAEISLGGMLLIGGTVPLDVNWMEIRTTPQMANGLRTTVIIEGQELGVGSGTPTVAIARMTRKESGDEVKSLQGRGTVSQRVNEEEALSMSLDITGEAGKDKWIQGTIDSTIKVRFDTLLSEWSSGKEVKPLTFRMRMNYRAMGSAYPQEPMIDPEGDVRIFDDLTRSQQERLLEDLKVVGLRAGGALIHNEAASRLGVQLADQLGETAEGLYDAWYQYTESSSFAGTY